MKTLFVIFVVLVKIKAEKNLCNLICPKDCEVGKSCLYYKKDILCVASFCRSIENIDHSGWNEDQTGEDSWEAEDLDQELRQTTKTVEELTPLYEEDFILEEAMQTEELHQDLGTGQDIREPEMQTTETLEEETEEEAGEAMQTEKLQELEQEKKPGAGLDVRQGDKKLQQDLRAGQDIREPELQTEEEAGEAGAGLDVRQGDKEENKKDKQVSTLMFGFAVLITLLIVALAYILVVVLFFWIDFYVHWFSVHCRAFWDYC